MQVTSVCIYGENIALRSVGLKSLAFSAAERRVGVGGGTMP